MNAVYKAISTKLTIDELRDKSASRSRRRNA